MTDEQEKQLQGIRERHRMVKFAFANEKSLPQGTIDIDFLLNLVDSQVAKSPVGWIMASVQPERPQNVLITFENSQQASAFMSNLEPCPDAATLMRSACIEAVRSLRHKSEPDDSRWNAALYHAETKLESTSIQEQEKQ